MVDVYLNILKLTFVNFKKIRTKILGIDIFITLPEC
jgi:hypothetical protein